MRPRSIHRSVVSLLAVLGLAAVTIAAVACTDEAPAGIADSAAHAEPLASANASPDVARQLAALRRTTAPFHDFEKAEAAGYDAQLTVCWFRSDLGAAMGYHYGDPDLIDGTAELLRPEILVYEPGPDGSLRLVAMEYIVPIAAWQGPGLPSVAGQEFHDNGAGLYILHIWLWRHNPSGMFADWNPKVSCEHAAASEDRAP